jgi:glycosyltransferase involved in cell wall biosynthesis
MADASGIGSYVRALVPAVTGASMETRFVFLTGKNPTCGRLCFGGKNCALLPCNAPVYSFGEQVELPFKIPHADIFWSPHYNVPIFPIRARKRLVTIHDVFHLAYFNSLTLTQKIYAKILINAAVRLSDKIITVSEFSKREIVKHTGVAERKIRVIHNGIDGQRLHVVEKSASLKAVKEKYGLPEQFILFVGNVKPHKNVVRLLLAFDRMLRKGFHDYGLVIVGQRQGFITGDKEVFRILEESPSVKKRTVFSGYVADEDLPAFYNLASLFVCPSLYEGFGLPPLEAMACGCPVVVSNVASLPEVCGDAAYYVDPYSVESIAEGIEKVLTDEDLRGELVRRGLERAKLFTWEKSAKEHMRVFGEVVNE